ncbi:MAG: hypothetical protein R3D26_07665 [Cyanobacteriota/Melainabacteria group bacterium]
MLRKPYVIYDCMYSNGIRKTEIPELQKKNFYNATKWHTADNSDVAHGKDHLQISVYELPYRKRLSQQKLIGERDKETRSRISQSPQETDPEKNPYSGLIPPLSAIKKTWISSPESKLSQRLTKVPRNLQIGKSEAKKIAASGGQ